MSIRKSLENNQGMLVAATSLILLVAGLLIYRGVTGGRARIMVPRWAYDLNTGRILIVGADQLAPFDTGSGTFAYPGMQERGAGVDAHIYSCGDPSDIKAGMTAEELAEVDARLVFVTRYPDDVADALKSVSAGGSTSGSIDVNARLLSDLTGREWVPHRSGPAFELREIASAGCASGQYPVPVEP